MTNRLRKSKSSVLAGGVLAACMLLPLQGALAQDQGQRQAQPQQQDQAAAQGGTISDTWVMWAKDGKSADLARAIAQHVAWRKQAGDPFEWEVYQPVVGDDLTHFVIRSENHDWKDLDALDSWSKKAGASEKFREQVGPLVSRIEHYIDEFSPEYSHWPRTGQDYPLYAVGMYQIEPGRGADVRRALTRIKQAATEKDFPQQWAVEWTTGGKGGMTVVWPHTSWADFADPNPTFMQVLGESMGSAEAGQKLMSDLSSRLEDVTYTVYRARPDLSTAQAGTAAQ